MYFSLNDHATTEFYALSLHDALPIFLLSDGLANVGETNPDAIATDVNRLAKEGVSTTMMGVGDDYNEDLMEAMARSGDRKSTRLNSSHLGISYAVFCLKKKKDNTTST